MSEFVLGEGEDRIITIMLVARGCYSEVNTQAINRTAKDPEKIYAKRNENIIIA
jgi:hypothetical protein